MYSEFFDWLLPNLKKIFDNSELQNAVSMRIDDINPKLSWETGPGQEKEYFFAISPQFDIENLELTKAITQYAPELPNWEFLYAKPKKQWIKRIVNFPTSVGIKEIYFDTWQYNLTAFEGNKYFDVNLFPPKELKLIEKDLESAGYFLVQCELGELMYLEIIDRVNIIKKPDSELNNIKYLYQQLNQIRV